MTTVSRPFSSRLAVWCESVLSFAGASHWRALLLLAGLTLAACLPGFVTLQPLDRDEPRFAQATKQMLETGDFIDIRFQEEARHKKPVGIYWLQSGVVAAGEAVGIPEARKTIALYRLPSLAGIVALVIATYWAATILLADLTPAAARRAAFLAAGFMAVAILPGVEARLAKTDAVLSACCAIAMAGLAHVYLNRNVPLRGGCFWAFWLAAAISVLVKGPILLMVAGLAALVLAIRERSARWLLALRPGWGFLIIMALVLPWFIAISIKSGGAFFDESVGKDMLAKAQSGQEKHWGPPGAYLLAFFGTFWPAAIFTAIGVYAFWRDRKLAPVAFCLAWVLPSWLIFEALPTKLPHYVLPLYPAIAILTARAIIMGDIHPRRPLAVPAALLIVLIPLVIGVGLSVFAWMYDGARLWMAWPGFALAIMLATLAWNAFRKDQAKASAVLMIPAALALSISVFGLAQPVIQALKISPRLAAAAQSANCEDVRLATTRYREPSLIFLTRTDLLLTNGEGAADFLAEGGCRMAFVEANDEPGFTTRLAEKGVSPALKTRVRGFNLNGGRLLDIGVYSVGERNPLPSPSTQQE